MAHPLLDEYNQVPVVTRFYATACFLTTLATRLELVDALQLYFNMNQIFQRGQVPPPNPNTLSSPLVLAQQITLTIPLSMLSRLLMSVPLLGFPYKRNISQHHHPCLVAKTCLCQFRKDIPDPLLPTLWHP